MNGSIAQVVVLVCAGNAMLKGRDVSGLWPNADVFKFTKECRFLAPPLDGPFSLSRDYVADNPTEWLAKQTRGSNGFRLRMEHRRFDRPMGGQDQERMTAGFVGGGPHWYVEVMRPHGSDLWEAQDRVSNKDDPDHRIWSTTYLRTSSHVVLPPPNQPPIPEVSKRLLNALEEIHAFANEVRADPFAKLFGDAIADLRSASPPASGYSDDIFRYGAPGLPARRLFAAASAAWVFGGMGSWNDLGFEGKTEVRYIALSDMLFWTLVDAIVAATNSTLQV